MAQLEGPRAEALEYLRGEKEVYMTTNILYQFWIQKASKNCKLSSEDLAKQLDETKQKYADFEKQDAKLREEQKYTKEQQMELQSMQKKELKKQKNIGQKVQGDEERVPELEKEVEKLQAKLRPHSTG
ncbi:unnamed protein product [Peronospora effusa]|nr:unnamed protein product [Peronospora effusa]